MTQELTNNNANQLIQIDKYMKFAEMMAQSDIVPKDFKGKPGNILVAIQMGNELGLKPTQALQNIAVINGRPCIWGDALLSLIQGRKDLEVFKEWMEGSIEKGDATAYCQIKRKGMDECIEYFDVKKATQAGLFKKPGPWQQYPERMLQLRARGFAVRNVYSDVLKGIVTREEAEDIREIKDVTPPETRQSSRVEELRNRLSKKEETEVEIHESPIANFDSIKNAIMNAQTEDEIMLQVDLIKDAGLSDDEKNELREVFKEKIACFSD